MACWGPNATAPLASDSSSMTPASSAQRCHGVKRGSRSSRRIAAANTRVNATSCTCTLMPPGRVNGGHPADERRAHQRGAEQERSTDLGPSDQHLDHRDAERADDHEHQPEEQQLDHDRGSGWPRTSGARRQRRLPTPPSTPAAVSRRRSSRRIAGSGQKRMHNESATAPAATSAANVTRVGVVGGHRVRGRPRWRRATPALANAAGAYEVHTSVMVSPTTRRMRTR